MRAMMVFHTIQYKRKQTIHIFKKKIKKEKKTNKKNKKEGANGTLGHNDA